SAHRGGARPPRAHVVGTCWSGCHACRRWLASVVSETGASQLFSKPHLSSRRGGNSDPAAGRSVTGTVGRLLRQSTSGRSANCRPAPAPELGLPALGGLRRHALRHLPRPTKRACRRIQPGALLATAARNAAEA